MNRLESEMTHPTRRDPLMDRAALDALRPRLNALPSAEVASINGLDATSAATLAEASATHLQPLRAALVAQFGTTASEALDALPPLARATRQADIEHDASRDSTNLSVLGGELRAAQRLLLLDAEVLVNRGLLPASALAPARGARGYQALARNVLVLVEVLRTRWSTFAGRTPMSPEDLARAEELGQKLFRAVWDRERGASRGLAAQLRARALSELVRTYEQVRRMVAYLRWHEQDADEFAPSLWSSRARRGRARRADEREEKPPVDRPVVPRKDDGPAPVLARTE
jgi:hypothetical protein